MAKRHEKWQSRVFDLVTAVPEPSGAVARIENTLDLVVFEVTDPRVKDSDRESINKMLSTFDRGRAGMLIWTVGECYPVWKVDPETGLIQWDVNSPMEIEAEPNKSAKVEGPDGKKRPLEQGEKIFRMWRRDPKKRFHAWSPHKGLLDVLEAMYLHQLSDTAVATSRLAGAGLLYWPTDLPSLPLKDNQQPEEGSREKLQQDLTIAMTQSIQNRDSVDATVPLIVFSDPSLGENFKPQHILLERPDDAAAWAARIEAYVQRYARGVDLPIESTVGMGPANHWTAWVVKEDEWRFYVKPLSKVLAKALTANFVRPILKQLNYPPEVYLDIEIDPDGTFLIEKPDKTDAALRLKQMNVMSDEAALRECGFNPATDKASPEEQARGQVRLQELPTATKKDANPKG